MMSEKYEQRNKEVILVVDDNRITCEVIQRNLEMSGFHLFAAESANDAIQILSRQIQIGSHIDPREIGCWKNI